MQNSNGVPGVLLPSGEKEESVIGENLAAHISKNTCTFLPSPLLTGRGHSSYPLVFKNCSNPLHLVIRPLRRLDSKES